ncbi:contactin-5-like [Oscarella lobularis]|uniref:contactin-5-like n=1 Tax=Oscarella lobularis TaxID=121494 RepID=UPI003313B3B2
MSKETIPFTTKAVIYGTPFVSLLLFAGNFAWLTKLQATVNLSCSQDKLADNELPASLPFSPPLPSRAKRDSDSIIKNYFGRIAEVQLKALKATCQSNEKLCFQGPKGDTGSDGKRGEKGEKGDQGMQGLKGSKGAKGDMGPRGKLGPLSISVVPPTFIYKPKDFIGIRGGTAVFECKTTGFPKPTIRWRKEGAQLPSHAIVSVHYRNKLTITNLKQDDEGQYVCVAENIFGIAESSAQLAIQAAPKLTDVGPKLVTVIPTNPVVALPCKASGFPQPKILWSRRGASLPNNSLVYPNGSLVISQFSDSDIGRYTCQAENVHGHVAHSTDISVYHEIVHGLEVVNNTKASIKCTICPFKKLTFDWKREDGKALPINRTKISNCFLEISPVLKQDAGNYSCIAKSKDSYSTQVLKDHVSLTVLAKPTISSPRDEIMYISPGENLTCCAVGPPSPKVTWIRHNKELSSGTKGRRSLQCCNWEDFCSDLLEPS